MQRMWQAIRWLAKTSWPLYTATVLGSNIFAAVFIILFLKYVLPLPDVGIFPASASLPTVGAIYTAVAVVVCAVVTFILFRPVLDWQRDPDNHDPNMVRILVMRIPFYQTMLSVVVWVIGIIIVTVVAAQASSRLALVIGVSTTLAGLVMCLLTYLEAERLMRPIAATALARRFEDSTLEPPITQRLRMTWVLTSAVPILSILLLLLGHRNGIFTGPLSMLIPAMMILCAAALVAGFLGTTLVVMSVVDPIVELQSAINRVRRGDTDVEVDIYDGSELGVLQAGFNEMMRGLRERQRVRDIFGRYVGNEVARRALEERPELGGEDREVAVIFVDVIGSTTFAVSHEPEEVVEELNKFFEHVVEVVHRNKGIINKFQGDAALAVFGAPITLSDATGHALQAARELRQELKGLRLQAGIGVAAGHVVAGHIGGHDRFEYTVIGDAVNTAARLTEIAKDTPGRVLTNAATLAKANEAEQARWTLLKSVELRGRNMMTQIARPIRPTLADRS
ncbi:family 3 adenylate cyclase [Corynebacterium mustelae]|uniref:Family 3 adenylate cyclase n=1 Tax=Corynebacterium mustelae TaxID=571915 RepID=A0A0G3GYA8_9CORY|nr:adenylate/guanylate cyclase domain-containing protein [Corynebacterium mustelae]AKK04553.1 family 3 adenylate cyclase [Corynebacterium mustelae]